MELFTVLINTLAITGVNDVDEALGVCVVVAPKESDLVLTTDVPHVERNVLVFDSLDVETNSRNRVDDLAELELVKNCGLASSVETDHQDSHLACSNHSLPDLAKETSHFDV